MKARRFLKYASWAMIFTALVHLVGHFAPPDLGTEEKKELMRLMTSVELDFDSWFTRSIKDIFDAFSLFLSVMLLILGGVCWTVVRLAGDHENFIKSVALVCLLGMLVMTGLSITYAFSIPIFLFLLISILLAISYFSPLKRI